MSLVMLIEKVINVLDHGGASAMKKSDVRTKFRKYGFFKKNENKKQEKSAKF